MNPTVYRYVPRKGIKEIAFEEALPTDFYTVQSVKNNLNSSDNALLQETLDSYKETNELNLKTSLEKQRELSQVRQEYNKLNRKYRKVDSKNLQLGLIIMAQSAILVALGIFYVSI